MYVLNLLYELCFSSLINESPKNLNLFHSDLCVQTLVLLANSVELILPCTIYTTGQFLTEF